MALSSIFNQIRAQQEGGGGYTASPAPAPYTASTGGLQQQTMAAPAPAPASAPATSGMGNLQQLLGGGWDKLNAGSNGWMYGDTPTTFNYGGRNLQVDSIGDADVGNQFIAYDPNDKQGSGAYVFDGSGNFVKHQAWRDADLNSWIVPLTAAIGMGTFLPGTGGFGGTGALGAGEAGALSGMDMAADTAGWWGSGGAAAGGIAPTVPLTDMGAISSGAVAPVTAEGAAAGGLGSVAAAGGGGLSITGNPLIDKIITGVGTSAATGAIMGNGGGGQSGGGGGGGLGGLLGGLISGGLADYQNSQMADKIFGYVNKANEDIDKLYSPNSPESKYLWDQMSAKDAASGRNSQYGVRTQEYAGKVAAEKARQKVALATGLSSMFGTGARTDANVGTGLTTALGLGGGGGSGGGILGSIIGSLGSGVTQNLSSYLNGTYGYNNWQSGLGTGEINGDQIYG